MCDFKQKLTLIRNAVKSYPDYPKPGVIFRDIFAVLKDPDCFKALHDICIEYVQNINPKIEAVAALDARGFLFGPFIALALHIPFVPIRKKGKLPGKVFSSTYELEYGMDTLEIQQDTLEKGTKMLIVDDLLATGGSLQAAVKLLDKAGMEVVQCLVIMELEALKGRSKITKPIHSFLQF